MAQTLFTSSASFRDDFEALLAAQRDDVEDVERAASEIIRDVRTRGVDALIDLTRRFDGMDVDEHRLRIGEDEIAAASERVSERQKGAIALAADRIAAFHGRQKPQDARWIDEIGMELGWRWTPVDAAGLYAPGGFASYPSSVLMNAIPARIAGVERLAMCVPTPRGEINPLVLYAARHAGVSEIYRIGGAQAIAALAYGAGPIAPVDVVVGPGNAYVATAKRQVFGQVGVDSVAGPSEVVVIADGETNPRWVAIDLLAQAEHDAAAQSILITTDPAYANAVDIAVADALETLPRREIAAASWRAHGAILICRDLDEAVYLTNRLAPEHLQICVTDAEALASKIRHAGAIFLGSFTPEAIGDYVGGPNHVLPTARAARYASGLSTLNFMKRTTVAKATPDALAKIGYAAETLAQAESLHAHELSVKRRLEAINHGGDVFAEGNTE